MVILFVSIVGLKFSCLFLNCFFVKGFRVVGLMCSFFLRNIGLILFDKFYYIEDKASYEDEFCDVNINI